MDSLHRLCSSLEPILRKVVRLCRLFVKFYLISNCERSVTNFLLPGEMRSPNTTVAAYTPRLRMNCNLESFYDLPYLSLFICEAAV